MNTGLGNFTEEEIRKIYEEGLAEHEAEAEAKLYKDWKPGQRKRPLFSSHREQDFYDELDENRWTTSDKRCGALGIKLGMMPVWDEWGERIPCTVLWLDQNIVLGVKTTKEHGYDAVQVGGGERKAKNVKKPVMGQLKKIGMGIEEHPPYIVREFRITKPETTTPKVGTQIHARHFLAGQNLDIAGISKGKGFAGPMKRHGFKGMPASHGVSKSHRAHGSTGQCQTPGKVFKGKKMAGRMGAERKTVQNLRLVKIDRGQNLLFVKGHVAGSKGRFVEIRDALKKPLFGTDNIEGGAEATKIPPVPTFEYDDEIEGSGIGGHYVFMPLSTNDPLVFEEAA